MKIHDNLTNEYMEIPKDVKIYLCGVTVYDESHIGHARTIIVFDVLRRYLEDKSANVTLVQNFTDIDDKIINRANKEGVTTKEISSRYIKEYFQSFDKLHVKRATIYPSATDHISDIIKFIEKLVKNNTAYVTKNGVYFDVSKFPEYGKLSKKDITQQNSGARIEIDDAKRDPLDFALWKFDESNNYSSPWGDGRPGWHIECSAMSAKYLGDDFEIHGGGRDLIFPHHENEIAQSESTGISFAKTWMHVGMVTINGEKMSKSLGNVRTVKKMLDGWGPNVLRLFCLSTHYSKPIDYTKKALKESLIKWRQIETCFYELFHMDLQETQDTTNKYTREFDAALEDNLNTHLALSAFFSLVKETNRLANKNTIPNLDTLKRMMKILGLRIPEITDEEKNKINALIIKRDKMRRENQFQKADEIRSELSKMNIEISDHKSKTIWIKREKIQAELDST